MVKSAKGKPAVESKSAFSVNKTQEYISQLLNEEAINEYDKTKTDKLYYGLPIYWQNISEASLEGEKTESKQTELLDIQKKLLQYQYQSIGGSSTPISTGNQSAVGKLIKRAHELGLEIEKENKTKFKEIELQR